jgi:cyclic beta-1,2-glucan synthetase
MPWERVMTADFETYTEIVVSPEDDIELRRVRITNRSRQRREIEVTSYAEVVIAPPAADALHPAFSNLFRADRDPARPARHPVHPPAALAGEQAPWMLHLMVVHGADRRGVLRNRSLRFIGRTRTTAAPLAMRFRRALGERGFGARPDCGHSLSHHA